MTKSIENNIPVNQELMGQDEKNPEIFKDVWELLIIWLGLGYSDRTTLQFKRKKAEFHIR